MNRLAELKAKLADGSITDDEKTELDELEAKEGEKEEVEIDEETAKKIASMVKVDEAGIAKKVTDAVLASVEKNADKQINKGNDGADGDGGEKEPAPAVRFVRGAIALIRGDRETLKAYNEHAIQALTRAGYANETTNADGAYIIALPEFEAEIEKLANVYGIAFNEADVRNISSNQVKTNKRGTNVTMYETGEGVAKTGTKLVISQFTATLRKFAAIAVATDELTDDSAIDFWAEVTQGFAEERARLADTLVFTDTNATYPGIIRAAGTQAETVGALITSLTWDNLMNAEVKVPTLAMKNGKHYMHRTVWNILRKSKASGSGEYMAIPYSISAGLQTPWGTPVVLVDVMPSSSVVGDSNEPFIVFGDLKRIKLYVKRGMVLTQLTEGTVHDSGNNAVNLAEQDMTGLRAVTRMVALTTKFPEAFCIIGTGTVS
jgi:HK97 family phage major capsid protein